MLTRDAILSADDLRTLVVSVPEWGGDVTVRELTGTERDEYESSVVRTDGDKVSVDARDMRAKLVVMSVVDEDGKRLFTVQDVKALGAKSAKALDRIMDVARSLSGIGNEALEAKGKDLPETTSGDSLST